ncbi:MAG: hypothetical protein R6U92_00380, partial [Bacillota bacterium]
MAQAYCSKIADIVNTVSTNGQGFHQKINFKEKTDIFFSTQNAVVVSNSICSFHANATNGTHSRFNIS